MTPAVLERAAALPVDTLPAYLYDLSALRTHAAAIRAALPARVEFHYAAKANPDPALLTALREYVDGYEVSSGGELAHVRATVPDAPLAFGGPGKTDQELTAALAAGVHRWHVESVAELHRLAARRPAGGLDILLRVNLPVAGGALDAVPLAMGGRPTPFGLDPADLDECLRLLATEPFTGLRLRGFHAHLASGLDAPALLALAARIVDWAARKAAGHGLAIGEVNIGGGMAVDYTDPAARFDWTGCGAGLARLLDRQPGLRLRIEPGRAVTAYCGWYATEVLEVKRSHGEPFAVVRGGTHHLRTPATRGHSQPFTVLPVADWQQPWPRGEVAGERVSLCGQLCTPKDALAQRVPVDRLRTGDRVVFGMAGAYAWNISHHDFLMHRQPTFHLIP
ncbi:diaminopimelate decarboxylase [Kitasatospora sp. GP30]|uniref:type III PLP-dependent enzyme n=1 Tax=Kitasatospora sp. GP30 TaxID=3035084 RepID=UPI000C70FB2B|nr:type III PLP-dependent enzyme [Kitasatospora sp. GP30]MDH6142246.1 diaminopimelate decarboxylase [Kitasatospora sp. GP30]